MATPLSHDHLNRKQYLANGNEWSYEKCCQKYIDDIATFKKVEVNAKNLLFRR